MSGSSALRKILYIDSTHNNVYYKGYHSSGCHDDLLYTARFAQSSSVTPRSSYRLSCACLASCLLGCITMRKRSCEKWVFGLLYISSIYFVAMKAHQVDNGILGHQASFLASSMGIIGFACRISIGSGSRYWNSVFALMFSGLCWYDMGRFNIWSDHASQLRSVVSPERSYDLLQDYVPKSVDIDFLPYRKIQ